ncbi:MAG: hypothetical protein NQU41_05705 [Candidatus Methanosuratincola sp.]|jgi:hypothetical protein|uniref:RCK N-terminal domain-containing protein n=1 Tax=Candidatus Methanosuratincola petrocarbonis (ex Vanwonterghem et al. 2016) TaxID=1867261 RepID=A0A7J3UXY5_9CREN|nr:hypothetical protein [Candidatus Methanosuratincola sp.]
MPPPIDRGGCFRTVLILGGGKYGTIALNRLRGRSERIIVVDIDPDCQAGKYAERIFLGNADPGKGSSLVLGDGASFLSRLIDRGDVPDFVILTIPKNVMAALFISWAESLGMKVLFDPDWMLDVAKRFPEKWIVAKDQIFGVLVASYARDHVCLDGCTQPEVCPVSGERREKSMIELAKSSVEGDFVRIFESRLLESDVGGVEGCAILEAYREFSSRAHSGMRIAIGTACRCHAIVNFMRLA